MNMNVTVDTAAPVAKGRGPGNPQAIKLGAITYPSIRAASNAVAKKTGEDEGVVYGRTYQRLKAGYSIGEALSTKPLKKGKKTAEVEYNGKMYASLIEAVKAHFRANHAFQKYDAAFLANRVVLISTRMKNGMTFDEASTEEDLRGQANSKETVVNGVTYPSMMAAIKANVVGLNDTNIAATYLRFTSGIRNGKTFEEILATPVRQYTVGGKKEKTLTKKEIKVIESYDADTELLDMIRQQAEENQAA